MHGYQLYSVGPSDIAINDYRDIYVTCSSNSSIHVFDQDGQQKLVQYCMAHMAIKRDVSA